MTWNYAYTPSIWPSVLTVLLLVALAGYAWRHCNVPGAVPFTLSSLLAALWMAGSILEIAAIGAPIKIFKKDSNLEPVSGEKYEKDNANVPSPDENNQTESEAG